jgi:hypothetical protein
MSVKVMAEMTMAKMAAHCRTTALLEGKCAGWCLSGTEDQNRGETQSLATHLRTLSGWDGFNQWPGQSWPQEHRAAALGAQVCQTKD